MTTWLIQWSLGFTFPSLYIHGPAGLNMILKIIEGKTVEMTGYSATDFGGQGICMILYKGALDFADCIDHLGRHDN